MNTLNRVFTPYHLNKTLVMRLSAVSQLCSECLQNLQGGRGMSPGQRRGEVLRAVHEVPNGVRHHQEKTRLQAAAGKMSDGVVPHAKT